MRRGKQDIDDFIANELGDIEGTTTAPAPSKPSSKPSGMGFSSKPAFAVKSKPGAFAKPSFAVGKKQNAAKAQDNLIEQELAALHEQESYASPEKAAAYGEDPLEASSQAYQPNTTPNMNLRKADITPSKLSSIKKGPAVFMKPNLPTKKKFQMAAPDADEQAKFDKMTVQQVKTQDAQREIGGSVLKHQIDKNVVAPIAMVKKTQQDLAYQKFNPRPPSSALNKQVKKEDSDGYSDEGYDQGFEAEEADDEMKLERIRRAMAKENQKAASKAATTPGVTKKVVVKTGPQIQPKVPGQFVKPSEMPREEEIIEEQMPSRRGVTKPVTQQQNPLTYKATGKTPLQSIKKELPSLAQMTPQKNLPTVQKQNIKPMAQPVRQPVSYPQAEKQEFGYNEPQKREIEAAPANMAGFAQQNVLIAGERVDHVAAGTQKVRAAELRELIQLEQEEFFNVFEMVPQTAQDIYFQKLAAGTVKTAIVSSSDENVDRDVQTEDLGQEDKWNQAPQDEMSNTYKPAQGVSVTQKRATNEAMQLEKFVGRAAPVLEQLLSENQQLKFMDNRAKASKRSACEAKEKLSFPQELLVMLGSEQQAARIEKVSCVHLFETVPQYKCAVAYEVLSPRLDIVHIICVYSTSANQVLRILKSESEVTQMCTPANDQVLIVGTDVGSISLFDLTDFESQVGLDFLDYKLMLAQTEPQLMLDQDPEQMAKAVKSLSQKFRVLTQTFQTDAIPEYMHFSPIRKLKFVSKIGNSTAQIGAMDELGVVSCWSVLEIQPHLRDKMGDFDLHMKIGGRFKLIENYSENLMYMPEVFDANHDFAQSLELEFDPTDHKIFYLSTSEGLFRCNRAESNVPVRLNTDGVGSPSALSMSDQGYLLVGFTCGSIALYNNNYNCPLTIWYNASRFPIVKLSWCWLYYNPDSVAAAAAGGHSKCFMTRLCEFFVIDKAEAFSVFNLSKNMNKPAHTIQFADKHASAQDSTHLYGISTTCADQTFYTSFLLRDNSVQLYMLNFKKGSEITREKLATENRDKSLNLLKTLPLNMERADQVVDL